MSPSKQHQDEPMDFCEPEQVLYNRCLEACLTWPCLLLLAVRQWLAGLLYPGCACRLPVPAQQSAVCWPAGRVPTILAMRLASNVILLLLGLLPQLWPKHSLVIAMYLARAALANAPYPIERAIIMDYVPKSMRAKWSSLESVLGFGWSGSAVAGGFLLDSYGFQFTFVTTALLQAIGTLVRPYQLASCPLLHCHFPQAS